MDMKHTQDHLAWLLAAAEHPHLKQDKGCQEALSLLETSPELSEQYEEALVFTQKYPELFAFNTLPPDARERIAKALALAAPAEPTLRASSNPVETVSPWSYRQQFAWAAVLALFLAGLSVLSSRIIEQQSPYAPSNRVNPPRLAGEADPLPEFHRFVRHSLEDSPQFQHQTHDTVQLVSWLNDHNGFAPPLPEAIVQAPGMGCAILESPHGNISMICVDVNGQKLKLFIACAKALRTPPRPKEALRIDGHEGLEWSNEDNVFLLIQSEPDLPMPEIML